MVVLQALSPWSQIGQSPLPEALIDAVATHSSSQNTLLEEHPGICTPRKMSLHAEAQRVAAQFEYSTVNVEKTVKEFIRQMGRSSLRNSGSERISFLQNLIADKR